MSSSSDDEELSIMTAAGALDKLAGLKGVLSSSELAAGYWLVDILF